MARKIRMFINTGFPAAKHEDFQDLPEDWDELSDAEQQAELASLAENYVANKGVDWGAHVVDDAKGGAS